jgi:hypothetical protein
MLSGKQEGEMAKTKLPPKQKKQTIKKAVKETLQSVKGEFVTPTFAPDDEAGKPGVTTPLKSKKSK